LENTAILLLQIAVFPLLGTLWKSVNSRIARLEDRHERSLEQLWMKLDRIPTVSECKQRHRDVDRRLSVLEAK